MWEPKTEFNYINDHPQQKELDGILEFNDKICSYTEWDPLKLTVIGTLDETSRMEPIYLEYERHFLEDKSLDQFPEKIVKTVQEESTAIAK